MTCEKVAFNNEALCKSTGCEWYRMF